MRKEIEKKHHHTFESLKQMNDDGMEFWSSRQLAKVLAYTEYRNFQPVIEKAKKACFKSGQRIKDHFVDMHEMVEIGSGERWEMARLTPPILKRHLSAATDILTDVVPLPELIFIKYQADAEMN